MKRALLALVLLIAGCATDPDAPSPRTAGNEPPLASSSSPAPSSSSPAPSSSSPSGRTRGTELVAASSPYGVMLYDASGQPIYLFDVERSNKPVCYGDCAQAWPPVLTSEAPRARRPVRKGLLGTTTRADGSIQVTYANHPLYYYAHEGKYQVLCHNVDEFGGTWLVVRPDGTPPAT